MTGLLKPHVGSVLGFVLIVVVVHRKVSMNKFEVYMCKGNNFQFLIDSGDGQEYAGCSLRLALCGNSVKIPLPPIIKPDAKKVYAKSWTAEDIKRLGRNYYIDYTRKEYGVYLFDNHFNIQYGRSTHDSSTEQRWSFFLPWTEYKYLGIKLFNIDGSLHKDIPNKRGDYKDVEQARSEVSKVAFLLKDFDDEEIVALCHIEERRWDLGVGICSWLNYVTPRRYRRVLSYDFSDEVGKRKGSWKGGTISSSIEMKDNEPPEAAIRRMCKEENMTFVSQVYGLSPEVEAIFKKRNGDYYRLLD